MTNTGWRSAAKVVVAAGAWSRQLLDPLGVRIPLETERGYHAMLTSPGLDLKLPISNKSRAFGVTPMEHGLRVAGTVEIAGLMRRRTRRGRRSSSSISEACSRTSIRASIASGWGFVPQLRTASQFSARRPGDRTFSSRSDTAISG